MIQEQQVEQTAQHEADEKLKNEERIKELFEQIDRQMTEFHNINTQIEKREDAAHFQQKNNILKLEETASSTLQINYNPSATDFTLQSIGVDLSGLSYNTDN